MTRHWEPLTQRGLLPGQDDSPLNRLSPHTSCFGFLPVSAASGENRADLFQCSQMQDIDSKRVVILDLASHFWFLLLSLVVEKFNHHSTHKVIWIFFALPYYSYSGMFGSSSSNESTRRIAMIPLQSFNWLLWVKIFTHCDSNRDGNIQKAVAFSLY